MPIISVVGRKSAKIMESMTVYEMKNALKRTKTLILPVGVIEQHGYHLPLNTDVYNAYEIAKRASKRTNCIVAPPVTYTFSGGTLPGTVNVSTQVVSLYIQEIIRSFVLMGFKNIIILLGHGGTENEVATKDACDMFLRQNPHLKNIRIAFFPFYKNSKLIKKAFLEKDFHAGYFETSLMLYWHPELVRKNMMKLDKKEIVEMMKKDQDAYQVKIKSVADENVVPFITQNPKIKIGVIGDPSRANRKLGKRIAKECENSLIKLIKKLEK